MIIRSQKGEEAIARGHNIRSIRSKRRQLRKDEKQNGKDHHSEIERLVSQTMERGGRA